jgi:GT2 family glycosyltransferase
MPRGADTSPLVTQVSKLVFRAVDQPQVSVIIVGWRDAPHLVDCLASLHESLEGSSYEVIVSLNEPSRSLLRRLDRSATGLTLHRSEVNVGLATACNSAAAQAHGEYLYLLNDDVRIEKGSIAALVRALEEHPESAAAGSKVLYPDGSLQEAGAVLWSDGSVIQVSCFVEPDDDLVDCARRSDYCSAASLLVRNTDWSSVQGFDEGYFPAYYEDVDLCLRFAALGRTVRYEPQSVVTHVMGASSSLRYREFLVRRNRQKILERWGPVLAEQEPRPDPMTSAAVRAAVLRTSQLPPRAQPSVLPEHVRLGRRRPVSCLRDELRTAKDFAGELEAFLDDAEKEHEEHEALRRRIGELVDELAIKDARRADLEALVGRLRGEIGTRDAYLERAYRQLEELALANDNAAAELQAVRSRRTLVLVDRLARLARRAPRAERLSLTLFRRFIR